MKKLYLFALLGLVAVQTQAYTLKVTHSGATTTISTTNTTAPQDIYSVVNLAQTAPGSWSYRGRCNPGSSLVLTSDNLAQSYFMGGSTNADTNNIPFAYTNLVGNQVATLGDTIYYVGTDYTAWTVTNFPVCTIAGVPDPTLLGCQLALYFNGPANLQYFLSGYVVGVFSSPTPPLTGIYYATNGVTPLGVVNGIDYSTKSWSYQPLPYPTPAAMDAYIRSQVVIPRNMTMTITAFNIYEGLYECVLTDGMITVDFIFGGPPWT